MSLTASLAGLLLLESALERNKGHIWSKKTPSYRLVISFFQLLCLDW